MGDKAQALLGDELSCNAADAVGLVLNAHKCSLKVLDELILPLGKGSGFLLGELESSIILYSLEGRGCVKNVVAAGVGDNLPESCIFRTGLSSMSLMMVRNSASSSSE